MARMERGMGPEVKLTAEEVERAKENFELLAQRLDELWQKPQLTPAEEKEVNLILNNAIIVQEMLEGKTPEEFREAA
ncbi:MAG: hypothetical protein UY99_C0017G0004 [Parcubacteria group bacterium GW2011_GWA1_59_11]|nr:MAG: hypothetical protein UY99_C0017G0004 [Parcubacteria group bacterium GW2011_GWA1_59_11]